MSTGHLQIVVQIPLVKRKRNYVLYQTFPTSTEGPVGTTITLETSKQYILISENRDQILTIGDNLDDKVLERGILDPKLTKQAMKRTSNDTSLSCWESILLGNFQGIEKACSWKVTAKLSTTEGIVRISASEVVITNKFKLEGSCISNITFVSFPLVISSSYECSLWRKNTEYRLTPQNLVNAKNITTKIVNFLLKYILRGNRSIFAKQKKYFFFNHSTNDVVEENEIALTQVDVLLRVIRAESVQLTELFC